jgi:hypothetical protein
MLRAVIFETYHMTVCGGISNFYASPVKISCEPTSLLHLIHCSSHVMKTGGLDREAAKWGGERKERITLRHINTINCTH